MVKEFEVGWVVKKEAVSTRKGVERATGLCVGKVSGKYYT
jgi:hypothetical protein